MAKNIQDVMHFLLICKFKNGQVNSNREKVEILTFGHSIVESGRIQALMVVHVTCKSEVNPFKNEGTRVVTKFPPL